MFPIALAVRCIYSARSIARGRVNLHFKHRSCGHQLLGNWIETRMGERGSRTPQSDLQSSQCFPNLVGPALDNGSLAIKTTPVKYQSSRLVGNIINGYDLSKSSANLLRVSFRRPTMALHRSIPSRTPRFRITRTAIPRLTE